MCLGIPGEIISIDEASDLRTAKVRFGGATRDAHLNLVPDAQVGDYVIVHVGFALSKIDADEAGEVFEMLRTLGGP